MMEIKVERPPDETENDAGKLVREIRAECLRILDGRDSIGLDGGPDLNYSAIRITGEKGIKGTAWEGNGVDLIIGRMRRRRDKETGRFFGYDQMEWFSFERGRDGRVFREIEDLSPEKKKKRPFSKASEPKPREASEAELQELLESIRIISAPI